MQTNHRHCVRAQLSPILSRTLRDRRLGSVQGGRPQKCSRQTPELFPHCRPPCVRRFERKCCSLQPSLPIPGEEETRWGAHTCAVSERLPTAPFKSQRRVPDQI
ncbi:hypothetical protein AAFF_G00183180 [Aldrovandia affinis]|uniref:Uncharacterized protein n=1 Tax=Aldrovandia affinis TaxID=143900 RepID=A0AAD7RJZ4_9TELE|nr:hypothetical protein AAFF_G00183180 [Aldrovandia affinis]